MKRSFLLRDVLPFYSSTKYFGEDKVCMTLVSFFVLWFLRPSLRFAPIGETTGLYVVFVYDPVLSPLQPELTKDIPLLWFRGIYSISTLGSITFLSLILPKETIPFLSLVDGFRFWNIRRRPEVSVLLFNSRIDFLVLFYKIPYIWSLFLTL